MYGKHYAWRHLECAFYAPINARVGISSLTCTSTCVEAAFIDESERMPKS